MRQRVREGVRYMGGSGLVIVVECVGKSRRERSGREGVQGRSWVLSGFLEKQYEELSLG